MFKYLKYTSGLSLIATILTLLIFSLFIAVAVSLVTTGSNVGVMELQGQQAFYIAEGGLDRTFDAFYNNKIGCNNSLVYNLIPLGAGTFTTSVALINPLPATTLRAGIVAGAISYIQVLSTAGYETAGRIWIDSEQLIYKGVSAVAADCGGTAPCFTVITREVDGTTADSHLLGATVQQKQCRVQSTGAITSNPLANPTQRVAETGVPAIAADFLDGNSFLISNAVRTNIGSLATSLGAGDNLIIVIVSLRNTTVGIANIIATNLRLEKGGATLASNESPIRVGNGAVPSATVFPQETQFLLYKDTGAAANPTYDVTALADVNNVISGEVKMIVINNAPNSSFQDGVNVAGFIGAGPGETIILSHNSTVPKGDNVIIAAVQLDNTSNANQVRTITAGNLRLRKVGLVPPLSSNQFAIDFYRANTSANRGTGVLLMARDVGAAANPTYTITGIASAAGVINGEAKIIVLNGLASAFLDTVSVGVGIAETVIGSLATTFPAGENVIIASTQYNNTGAAQRNILGYESTTPLPGNERIVFNNTPQSYNQFDTNLCTGTSQCDDFASGLLWHHLRASANPTYDIRALADNPGINGKAKIMAIHIKNKVPIYRKENY